MVERFSDKEEVEGSIPSAPTMEDSNKKTTDLSQIFKQKEQNFAQPGANVSKQVFSFSKTKQKQKIELIILVIILAFTAGVLIYYFTSSHSRIPSELEYTPAAE